MNITPIFVDGPLVGQRYTVDSYRIRFPVFEREDVVYKVERFRLTFGEDEFNMLLAYCSPTRPDARTIMGALLKPEVMDVVMHITPDPDPGRVR